MNVTELARQLKLNTVDLLEILPEFGFDVGKKAIKVDNKIARRILDLGNTIKEKIESNKLAKQDELKKISQPTVVNQEVKEIKVPPIVTVRDFASLLGKPINEVIKLLMKNGVMASLNERIDFDTAAIIADEFGCKLILAAGEELHSNQNERVQNILDLEKKEDLKPRAPVIVVMGHVDHGKTKLLDTIRKTNVIDTEAGGITQHIGAYQVKKKGQQLTFIDTPGHEAFTAMRSRGAKVADIAILIVAANDSIKPQTTEAIKIIQQAQLPMVVAINKIDLPDANIEKVKQDLSSLNLVPEDWGGKTITVPISAKANLGIDDLLETLILVAEMNKEDIKANPDSNAVGTIIESHVTKGEGPVATLLVQNGTLRIGDNLCINDNFFGKVRNLKDYLNSDIKEAGPSVPVKVIGLKYSPKVGDIVEVVCNIERKQKKVDVHQMQKEETFIKPVTRMAEEGEENIIKKLNIIIKADVLGSLEAISDSLEKIESSEVKIKILARGLGNITDSEIKLAESSNALIVGFNVKATPLAEDLAREKKVEIKYYNIIYKLIEEVKAKMSALLSPEILKKVIGKIEVLAIFRKENKSMVIGGKVLEGMAVNKSKVSVFHQGEISTTGEITQLQSGKQDVNEVAESQQCGISYSGKPEILVGDIMEVFQEETIIKKI